MFDFAGYDDPDYDIAFAAELAKKGSPLAQQVGGGHYKKHKIQPVEYCHANNIPYIEGAIIKYATRWRDKGGIEDLRKIVHFAELLIELEQKQGN